MKATRVMLMLAMTIAIVPRTSGAAPECELFLYSGISVPQAGVGPAYDPAGEGCWLPGGPYDTSVLTPGALDVSGLVWGSATPAAPTHARIVFRDAAGDESRTPVTFRWHPTRGYFTTEHVLIPPTATSAAILARFNGALRSHEYMRLLPP